MITHLRLTLAFAFFAIATHTYAVQFGVNATGGISQTVREWEAFTGSQPEVISDNMFYNKWDDIRVNAPNFIVNRWGAEPRKERFLIAVPMFPRNITDFNGAVNGSYDYVFRECAQRLINGGFGSCTLRLGWEFNGAWSPWHAPTESDREKFRRYWRRIHDIMMNQAGANFKWDWNVSVGDQTVDATGYYPGDAYVDFIGVDVYDTNGFYYFGNENFSTAHRDWAREMVFFLKVWGFQGLNFWRDFARARNKPFTISEWGLWETYYPNAIIGGNDNPYFIEQMYRWIIENDVHSACYFEVSFGPGENHRLLDGNHPQGRQKYKDLFVDNTLGGGGGTGITINVNGALNDWPVGATLAHQEGYDTSNASTIDLNYYFWTNDATNVYIGAFNEFNVSLNDDWIWFLDTNQNNNSGYRAWGVGADHLIRNNNVFRYTGNGSNWSWQFVGTANTQTVGKVIEYSFPRSWIGNPSQTGILFYGRRNNITELVPNNGQPIYRSTLSTQNGGNIQVLPPRNQGGISINGSMRDWSPRSLSTSDNGEYGVQNGVIDIREIFMTHDAQNLVLAYRTTKPFTFNDNWMLFLDTNQNAGNGYQIFNHGAEYLIRKNNVYRYTGNGSNWSWQFVGSVNFRSGGQVHELSIPRSLIGNPGSFRYLFYGPNGGNAAEVVGAANNTGINYSF